MKKIFTIIILTIGLITFANAQGITNTLGGNTAADKFIVENSDSEAGLVVTGEGNVGIGTTNPLSKLSVGGMAIHILRYIVKQQQEVILLVCMAMHQISLKI